MMDDGKSSSLTSAQETQRPVWPQSILVQGVGGIGGMISGKLISAGYSVTCLCGNQRIADALNQNGIQMQTFQGSQQVKLPLPALVSLPSRENCITHYDVIIVATPPAGLEKALEVSAPFLAKDGRVLCIQNGLPEPRALKYIPAHQLMGCVLSWGANMPSPGCYEQTSEGGIQLGYAVGPLDERAQDVARLLGHISPVQLKNELQGIRWSKLAISSAITSLGAIGGKRLGLLLRHRYVRRLAMEVFTEVLAVARKKGIKPAPLNGVFELERFTLSPNDRRATMGSPTLFMKHSLLLALGMKYRRMRSSMLYALERGRAPGAEYLNGEVVEAGKAVGVRTPVNEALLFTVNRIANGELHSGEDTLRHVYDSVRPLIKD